MRLWRKRVVSLPLKFSSVVKDFTRNFIGNNSEHVVDLNRNSLLYVSSCHRVSKSEDAFHDTSSLYTVTNYQ